MTTLHSTKSIVRSPLRLGLPRVQRIWTIRGFLILALVCFGLSSTAQAVSPAPDGGYAGGNTAEGQNALQNLTSGTRNTANGAYTLSSNTTGSNNTATGFDALLHTTTVQYSGSLVKIGQQNTAVGSQALYTNTTGSGNTAAGYQALFHDTAIFNSITNTLSIGEGNTASGSQALYSNTTGSNNTANGYQALYSNTIGIKNTATGYTALANNTTGVRNTADGEGALLSNTTGDYNTATGHQALANNTTGPNNTADGQLALQSNTIGDRNVAVGRAALQTNTGGAANTAIGTGALVSNTTGRNNIALGVSAGSNLTGSNNIDLGNVGVAAESNTIRIGTGGTQTATFIAGINLAAIAGNSVVVAANHRLGVATSSARFKNEIKPMNKASEAILTLKPVTFRYKKEIDPDGIPQFGLVAEEVEKVNPDLVSRDRDGKPYTVRYEAVNAMLLNEFLKEHRKVEGLEATVAKQKQEFEAAIAQQRKEISALTVNLKEQATQIQKVSAELELRRPVPQIVDNTQQR